MPIFLQFLPCIQLYVHAFLHYLARYALANPAARSRRRSCRPRDFRPPRGRIAGVNAAGIAGLLVAAFVAAVWMLPRTLDAALRDPLVEAAKFTSVPLLIGAPLALSWPLLPPVARAFVWANVISVLGWLYRAAPDRLCARYLFDQQATVGSALLIIAVVLLFALASYAIAGSPWQGRTVCRCAKRARTPASRRYPRRKPWSQD